MARPIRIEYEAAVYHVTMRGNDRRAVFEDDPDHERFLVKLSESVDLFEIRLYLYCLMTNHVHLVLGTPRANLSRFMQRLETAYTVGHMVGRTLSREMSLEGARPGRDFWLASSDPASTILRMALGMESPT